MPTPVAEISPANFSGDSLSPGFSDGFKLLGPNELARYLGGIATIPNFYQRDRCESIQTDALLNYASALAVGAEFEKACKFFDEFLLKRCFLVGHQLSIADVAVWSGLTGNGVRWESLRKSTKKYPNLVRWFNSISTEYDAILSEIASTYIGKKGSKGKEHADKEIDLPDAVNGKVKLRFAPEPNGFLHIGHTKAALLNQKLADRYNGEMIVRIDDTNPAKESNEFIENLLKDTRT